MPSLEILNSNLVFNEENKMCATLSKLINITMQNMQTKYDETRNEEMLYKYIKSVYNKIKGFKRAYSMLIYVKNEEIN